MTCGGYLYIPDEHECYSCHGTTEVWGICGDGVSVQYNGGARDGCMANGQCLVCPDGRNNTQTVSLFNSHKFVSPQLYIAESCMGAWSVEGNIEITDIPTLRLSENKSIISVDTFASINTSISIEGSGASIQNVNIGNNTVVINVTQTNVFSDIVIRNVISTNEVLFLAAYTSPIYLHNFFIGNGSLSQKFVAVLTNVYGYGYVSCPDNTGLMIQELEVNALSVTMEKCRVLSQNQLLNIWGQQQIVEFNNDGKYSNSADIRREEIQFIWLVCIFVFLLIILCRSHPNILKMAYHNIKHNKD